VATLTATLAALVATGKVLSPQYLLWLIPLVALLPRGRGLTAAALLVAAMALSHEIFPGRYRDLVENLGSEAVLLLLARDALLVLLVVASWPRAGRTAARRSSAAGETPMPGVGAPLRPPP